MTIRTIATWVLVVALLLKLAALACIPVMLFIVNRWLHWSFCGKGCFWP